MKKILIVVVVVIIIGTALFFLWRRITHSENNKHLETTMVERGDIEVKVLSTGTIEPYTRVEVASPVNGRIDRVEVDEGERVSNGDVLAWISSEDRIAVLDAARAELETAQRSGDEEEISEAKETYEIAQKAYNPVPLTNSISGEVIDRSCQPGQNVSTATILFVIADRLVARVEVDEADIGRIEVGQSAWIVLDAYPEEKISSRVAKISREGEMTSDVVFYDVMVEARNVPAYWASGMTANVEFIIEGKEDVLLIPRSAVKEMEGKQVVLLLNEKLKPIEIETGISDGKMVEIKSGLKEGDEIVSTANSEVDEILKEGNRRRGPMPRMMGRPPR
jgi:macrolide-specific efflux system membrane fusion protein